MIPIKETLHSYTCLHISEKILKGKGVFFAYYLFYENLIMGNIMSSLDAMCFWTRGSNANRQTGLIFLKCLSLFHLFAKMKSDESVPLKRKWLNTYTFFPHCGWTLLNLAVLQVLELNKKIVEFYMLIAINLLVFLFNITIPWL